MPENFSDKVNRILRDHEGYDGNGGDGVLPVGDRTTARKPISKRDLRSVILAPESYAIRAEDAADRVDLGALDDAVNATAADRMQTGLDVAAAEAARDSTILSAEVYETIGDGLAATVDGEFFKVLGSSSDYYSLYENVVGAEKTRGAIPLKPLTDGMRTDLTDVYERTVSAMEMPPVNIGERLLLPDALTFDLKVQRGHWSDSGLPWTRGGEFDDVFTVNQIGDLLVTDWSFDLRPVRGVSLKTGRAFPEAGDVVEASQPMLVETVSDSLVRIYIWQAGSAYVRWEVKRAPRPERNSDVWRIGVADHVVRGAGGGFTLVRDITFDGETDVAIQLKQSVGGANKPDHIGGYIHGNEETQYVTLLVNGAALDTSGIAGVIEASTFELIQASDMFEPGNTSETIWSPKGQLIMRHYKRLAIDPSGWWRQESRVEHVVDGFEVSNAYFGMLCMLWGRGFNTVHTGARSPYWADEDISVPSFTQIYDTSEHVKAWGDIYGGEVRLLSGWDATGRNIKIDNRSDRRKIYPDFFDGEITETGTPWSVVAEYRVGVKENI